MENLLFQTSLIAAFIAGMVALFAPCCITFLLPAYLGGVFKEKEKVLFMTLVFGLGIFAVMLPAVLGVALISKLIFRYHSLIYIVGGMVMLFAALFTFLGIKMPMPSFGSSNSSKKPDVLSVFTLGIISGITSACCAPVLVGILALTFISPSFLGAITVGAIYVLGMVTPLLLIALFLNNKIPKLTILKKPIAGFTLLGKSYMIILSNVIASGVFLITGAMTLTLTYKGALSQGNMEGFSRTIQNISQSINSALGNNIFINIIFLSAAILFIYKIIKKA